MITAYDKQLRTLRVEKKDLERKISFYGIMKGEYIMNERNSEVL